MISGGFFYFWGMEINPVLFEPTGRDLRVTYPELNDIEEFEDLNASELAMCWYIGSKTSPIYKKFPASDNESKKKRIAAAIDQVFQPDSIAINKDLQSFYEGRVVPARYKKAIQRFNSFDLSYRLRSRFLHQAVLKNIEMMLIVDQDDLKDMGPEDYKSYLSAASSALTMLPKLQEALEGNFGLTLKKVSSNDDPNEKVAHRVIATIDDLED